MTLPTSGDRSPAVHPVAPQGTAAPPAVTVVIMTRDRRDNLLSTLDRLTALPERPPIIVVDNASGDGTTEAVARCFPEVCVLSLDRNHGAPARTIGVQAATTPYVAFADDDSWWAPGALAEAAQIFQATPRLGLLAARILVGPEQRLDPVCEVMAASPLPRDADAPGPSVLGFVACGAVVRREAYLHVGGFSPVTFFFGEESLLAQDLMSAGWQLAYVDGVVAHHDPDAAIGDRSGRDRLAVRNELLSTWMRRPLPVAVIKTVRLIAGRRDRAALGGLTDALRRSPRAIRHRSVLPPRVERQVRLLERTR
jgi:GT2 family glycosyltransferase